MAVSDDVRRAVLDKIDENEVVDLALELGGIPSPTGSEGEVANRIHEWLSAEGFDPRKVAALPDRPNVATRIRGAGNGPSLMLNGHMDTSIGHTDLYTTPSAADPIFHLSRREGDTLIGNGVVNNKGIVSTWMLAAKALKDAGVQLSGDLILAMVVGEISVEPVDEFQPPEFISKDIGARYLVSRGWTADYAVVAEGTNFAMTWVEAGKVFFKIRVLGVDPPVYTPYVPHPTTAAESPSAVVRATEAIRAIEEWATRYQKENEWHGEGGVVVPKVSVNAIRGGLPHKVTKTPAVCDVYIDVRTNPDQNPRDVERELKAVLDASGVPTIVEPFLWRRGYQATGIEPVTKAITTAHGAVLGGEPAERTIPHTSMWRDSNPLNEAGIPTVCYGPGVSTAGGKFAIDIAALTAAAKIYALIAMETCGVAD
jgi:acetylornithine deacetylase/succinyl-diaminopimelate desuccinylase-like protein